MQELFNLPFPYFDKFRYRVLHVLIILVFSALFLITFKPFNIVDWLKYPAFLENFGLVSLAVILTVIIAVSQLVIRTLVNIPTFRIHHLSIWLISEILVITLALTFLFGEKGNPFFIEYLISLKFNTVGLALPYAFSILVLALLYQNSKLSGKAGIPDPDLPDLVHFRDEREQVKFSVQRSQILYLESSDNYITIFYTSEDGIRKELIRNSMKQMEQQLSGFGFVRCHRSFMLNIENVEWIKKEGRNYLVRIKGIDSNLPVSRGYIPTVKSLVLE